MVKKQIALRCSNHNFENVIRDISRTYTMAEELAAGDYKARILALNQQSGRSVNDIVERILPKVVGHRFHPEKAVENSIEAFRLAVAEGVDAMECDVVRCQDDLVIFHDPTLSRLVPGDTRQIQDVPVSEIKSLVITDPHLNARYGHVITGKIPVFNEFLKELKHWFDHNPDKTLCLELKQQLEMADVDTIVARLDQEHLIDRIHFFSFDPDLLKQAADCCSRLAIPLSGPLNRSYLLRWQESNPDGLSVKLSEMQALGNNFTYFAAKPDQMTHIGGMTTLARAHDIFPYVGQTDPEQKRQPRGYDAYSKNQLEQLFQHYAYGVLSDFPDVAIQVRSQLAQKIADRILEKPSI